nr:anti-phage dCTP deaminase [uncultured Pedobacter sp.]
MKLIFTGTETELKEKLKSLEGDWNSNQPNKVILRSHGGIMNWFITTGTVQFQGNLAAANLLETNVKQLLYPEEYAAEEKFTAAASTPFPNLEEPVAAIEANEEDNSDFAPDVSTQYLQDKVFASEIIIGLVSAVGTEVSRVTDPLKSRLQGFGYEVIEIRVSSLLPIATAGISEYNRISHYMSEGDKIREQTSNNGILAYGAAKLIKESRPENKKIAYIINSLKHPDEVSALRKIYGHGFYLIGIHSDKKRRLNFLMNDKTLKTAEATELISIDEDEQIKHGQKTRDTFHLSDFYLNLGKNEDQVKNTIQRFLELIFSQPYRNPTFDEFAMFMAFSSSVRSGDLSRQVGAVIAKNKQIIATGANEVPSFGGGHYWAEIDENSGEVIDVEDGKDYMRQRDSNKVEQNEIIGSLEQSISTIENISEELLSAIREKLNNSRIGDLTEFGRVVHAEMQAILSCAKEGISCIGSTLYCTTFPCHNCAKHLIAAGIKRVVYVEPYAKSKALEFHNESITTESDNKDLVLFEPFIGVGSRRFLDFFSMNSGAGSKLKRKDKDGLTVNWNKETANPRVILLPESYLDIETAASNLFNSQ